MSPSILIADLDEVGDEINECLDMYHQIADRYADFKNTAYKTILDEDYLKMAFNQGNN